MKNELSRKVIGAAFVVHNTLGHGFSERIYHNAMLVELQQLGFSVSSEHEFQVIYKDYLVGDYRIDLYVEKSLIVEIKIGKQHPGHFKQVLNYLKGMNSQLGLILYFNESVTIKRIINH